MPEQNHNSKNDIIPIDLEDGTHYYDPTTGDEITEMFEAYENENGNDDYNMHEDFEEDGEDENWETDEDSEDGEENEGENENDGDNTGKKKKDKNNEDEPTEDGDGDDNGGGESSGSNFDSSLVTDHMGETGEKIEKGKELVEDAENLAKAIESEGADLKADWELAKKYGPKAIKTQLISLGAVIAFISIPIILFIMAFMGYGGDNDNSLVTGYNNIICLDAGHGDSDSGATNDTFKEANMNLIIVKELKPKLEDAGYTVITTRLDNDYLDPSNSSQEESIERSTYCHSGGAALMYRVHLDCAICKQKTFHILPSMDHTNIYDVSTDYGEKIHETMIQELGGLVVGGGKPITDGGVVHEGSSSYSTVLKGTIKANELSLPIVWLEGLAINNEGVAWIENTSNRAKLVEAIAKGISAAVPVNIPSGNIAQMARSQKGKPYVWGGCHRWTSVPEGCGTVMTEPVPADFYNANEYSSNGFDCSGLTGWSLYWGTESNFMQEGDVKSVKANMDNPDRYQIIPREQAQPGDIILFPGHIAIYTGQESGTDMYIHAPGRGKIVKEVPLTRTGIINFLRPVVNP